MRIIVLLVLLGFPVLCDAQYKEFLFFKRPAGNPTSVFEGEYYEETTILTMLRGV